MSSSLLTWAVGAYLLNTFSLNADYPRPHLAVAGIIVHASVAVGIHIVLPRPLPVQRYTGWASISKAAVVPQNPPAEIHYYSWCRLDILGFSSSLPGGHSHSLCPIVVVMDMLRTSER